MCEKAYKDKCLNVYKVLFLKFETNMKLICLITNPVLIVFLFFISIKCQSYSCTNWGRNHEFNKACVEPLSALPYG